MKMCGDCFHKDCLDNYFKSKDVPFKCPKCYRDIY